MVTLSTEAQIALRSLLPQDRERVTHLAEQLDGFPTNEYLAEQARPLKGEGMDDLYLLRVTRELRLLFSSSQGKVEIVDIFPRARLEKMHG
jgi:hypothetical protein